MFAFVIGVVLIGCGLLVPLVLRDVLKPIGRTVVALLLAVLGLVAVVFSTSLWVGPNEGGLITKKFGEGLKEGHIIAVNGERGVQADVLSPGWSFGWAPWQYDLESVENKNIAEGKVGVVTAFDGLPLPEGEVYAPAWESPTEMIDARLFLTRGGVKGPQLTVLPPGQYRYNPKQFAIAEADVTDVSIGHVRVVRANAGKNADTNTAAAVFNGVPMVAQGYKGIWMEPLMPGKYNLHPNAYQGVPIRTTKRVYSYTGSMTQEANMDRSAGKKDDNSILVRSKDGFTFPVDVRASVMVSASNAPKVVALLGNPDDDPQKDGFDVMEEICILPSIRALLRNAASAQNALDFVNSRDKVEAACLLAFKADMSRYFIDVEAIYLADIRLDASPEGKELLTTQTDRQLADQRKLTYDQQRMAESNRAEQVKAKAAADQQERIQISLAGIEAEKNNAIAAENKARGLAAQAAVYKANVDVLGVDKFISLEVTKLLVEKLGTAIVEKGWPVLPQIMVSGQGGQGGSALEGLTTTVLAQLNQATLKASTPGTTAPAPATK